MPVKVPECRCGIRPAALLLTDGLPDRRNCRHEKYSGQTDKNKGQLPRPDDTHQEDFPRAAAFGVMSNQSAADVRHSRPQHDAAGEYVERQAPFFAWEIVRDQRVRAGRQARFPDPHTHACEKQFPVTRSLAAENGHAAPQSNPDEQQVAPRASVGHSTERDAHCSIESHKCQALDQAELEIVDMKIRADRADKICNNRPVYE